MSTVELKGRIREQQKAAREAAEREHHQFNDFTRHNWITQDKTGKCYTYRGIKYCY